MAHQKKHHAPIPSGNQTHSGPDYQKKPETNSEKASQSDGSFAEQDPKRRLGDYATAGEHPLQQPGGKNDANKNRG